jgi:hypothetical protein
MHEADEEMDEIEKMKRIKLISPELYQDMNDKMMDIALVKNLILEYNTKKARRLFDNLLKESKKPSR